MLRSNKVHQQEQQLRHKFGLERVKSYLPDMWKSLEECKVRVLNLQDSIFRGTPFEL
jgi:hypothetical protein